MSHAAIESVSSSARYRASASAGGIFPIGLRRRRLLNRSVHSRVANSTASSERPGATSADYLGLVEIVDALRQSVVIAVADAADRRLDARFCEALGVADCTPDQAVGLDGLARAAAQRCDARRRSGVSGQHGAVALRARGPATEACEVGDQRGVAGLRAGAFGRDGREPQRGCDPWAGRLLEITPTWTRWWSARRGRRADALRKTSLAWRNSRFSRSSAFIRSLSCVV